MPFMIPVLAAIGGGSAAAGAVTLAGTAASAYGAIKSANAASKAAGQAGQASQVDIDALNDRVNAISKQNALDSAELERQLTPEVPQLRKSSVEGLLKGLTSDKYGDAAGNLLTQNPNAIASAPLLADAVAKAKADLALGGKLDVDTQNAVTRNALARTGSITGGLGLGRDVTARDLGLTSLQLQGDRLNRAAALGETEGNFNLSNASTTLNRAQLLSQLSGSNFGKLLGAAQFGQSIQQPNVGLDPSAIANLVSGNATNASAAGASQANIAGAQSQGLLGLTGNLLGVIGNNFSQNYVGRSGVGQPMNYTQFLSKYPNSSAATGSR